MVYASSRIGWKNRGEGRLAVGVLVLWIAIGISIGIVWVGLRLNAKLFRMILHILLPHMQVVFFWPHTVASLT